MSAAVYQTRRFARHYKSLQPGAVPDVDAAVDAVAANPKAGAPQLVDLGALHVLRFACQGEPWLLGYTVSPSIRLIHLASDCRPPLASET